MTEQTGRSTVWKFVAGCAIGCGVLLLLAFSACVGFVAWVRQPGELIEPARLTGSETIGAATWTLRLEDPGTEAFVTSFLGKLQAGRPERERDLPPFLRGLGDLQEARNERQLRGSFPVTAGVLVEPGGELEAGLPRTLGYLSLEAGGNRLVMADWMMTMAWRWMKQPPMVEHADERILLIGDEDDPDSAAGFFLRGNDLFLASRLSIARTAVDRLNAEGPAARTASPLDELLGRVPENATIRGAFLNDHGELARLLSALPGVRNWTGDFDPSYETDPAQDSGDRGSSPPDDPAPYAPGLLDLLDQARRVTLEGGFDQDRSLRLDLRFTCVEPECGKLLSQLEVSDGEKRPPEWGADASAPAGAEPGSGGTSITVTRNGTEGLVRLRIENPGESLGDLLTVEPRERVRE